MNILCWLTSIEASQLGNFLTGVAAILALLSAPFGIKLWRKQKREEKAAEVAQAAYSRISRFLESIRYISIPFSDSSEENEKVDKNRRRIHSFRPIFYERAAQAERTIQDFLEIWPDVEALLPLKASKLFDESWGQWASIKANFETFCMLYSDGDGSSQIATEYYTKSLGSEVRQKIDSLKIQSKEILSPLVQFQNTK